MHLGIKPSQDLMMCYQPEQDAVELVNPHIGAKQHANLMSKPTCSFVYLHTCTPSRNLTKTHKPHTQADSTKSTAAQKGDKHKNPN